MEGTRPSWPASGKTRVGLELLPPSGSGAVAMMVYYFPRCHPHVPTGTLQRLCLSVAASLQVSNPFAGVALETNLLFGHAFSRTNTRQKSSNNWSIRA